MAGAESRGRYDAIVVGSGPLGSCVARGLVEEGRTVAIVERGAAVTEPPGSHLRNIDRIRARPDAFFAEIEPFMASPMADEGKADLPAAQVTFAVGGQGIVWTNNCPRAVAGLERWSGMEEPTWERLYAAAEGYLSVLPARSSRRQARIAARLDAALPARTVLEQPFAGRIEETGRTHYIGPSDILGPVADGVEIVQGQVRRVVFDGDRAVGVNVGSWTIEADEVIIAAGALETPLLLHQSGLELSALGRWLTFHEVLFTQVVLDQDLVRDDDTDDAPPRLMIPPDADHPWHVMVLRDTNPLPPSAPDIDADAHRLVEIQAFCPIDPAPANRITLDGGVTEVSLSPADRERKTATMRDVGTIIESIGRPRAGCEPQWLPSGAHVMGTCRIGEGSATSVTDPEGRVHGHEHLWLATVGLIPTRLAVNPTLTGSALAIGTAEAILRN